LFEVDAEAYCRFAGPELATIAANGGMHSATADITTDARIEYRQMRVQASTISTRQVPIMMKYARFRVLSRSGRCGEFGDPSAGGPPAGGPPADDTAFAPFVSCPSRNEGGYPRRRTRAAPVATVVARTQPAAMNR